MTRRSATECAATLEACRKLDLLDAEGYETGRALLLEVVSMLVRLIRNLGDEEGQGRGQGQGPWTDEP